jgi:hypothetical protein
VVVVEVVFLELPCVVASGVVLSYLILFDLKGEVLDAVVWQNVQKYVMKDQPNPPQNA